MTDGRERRLLELWETGQCRHPIDRALLLCSWGQSGCPQDELACRPLGRLNVDLLRLRAALFGAEIVASTECGACGALLEVRLTIDSLIDGAPTAPDAPPVELDGFCFRLPDSRDLAAIAGFDDLEFAAETLLGRCCLTRPDGADLAPVAERAALALEAADPLADLQIDTVCEACGCRWSTSLDPAHLLWDEVERYALELLAQVHTLARAYGWSEAEVMTLSPLRRATYLQYLSA